MDFAPPPIPTTADKLPVAKLHLPKNFDIEIYASGIPDARSLRVDDKGTVFVSNRRLDKVYAIVDRNGKREIDNINAVALLEDERLHLRVPSLRLVSKMNSRVQEFRH